MANMYPVFVHPKKKELSGINVSFSILFKFSAWRLCLKNTYGKIFSIMSFHLTKRSSLSFTWLNCIFLQKFVSSYVESYWRFLISYCFDLNSFYELLALVVGNPRWNAAPQKWTIFTAPPKELGPQENSILSRFLFLDGPGYCSYWQRISLLFAPKLLILIDLQWQFRW